MFLYMTTAPRHEDLGVRQLDGGDLPAIQRILETSDYTYYHFGFEELPGLLDRLPALGVFSEKTARFKRGLQESLQAFLLINWLVPPSAWLGGFGTLSSEGHESGRYLDLLLPSLESMVAAAGARTLYYSGNDLEIDWLRPIMEARHFQLRSLLRSYDKEDFTIPSPGNTHIQIRRFTSADAAGVVAVENLAFEQLWRHDVASFLQVQQTYPYFVVARDEHGIVGYQYNTVDGGVGYLVRIAVHPRVAGQGVGTRLMAEAVRYFQAHHVWKIVLNTEESNVRAQALYERFGFHLVYQRGFVLERAIALS
jgi:ribosomal protein S18 acetylase RimI-like enzyme